MHTRIILCVVLFLLFLPTHGRVYAADPASLDFLVKGRPFTLSSLYTVKSGTPTLWDGALPGLQKDHEPSIERFKELFVPLDAPDVARQEGTFTLTVHPAGLPTGGGKEKGAQGLLSLETGHS